MKTLSIMHETMLLVSIKAWIFDHFHDGEDLNHLIYNKENDGISVRCPECGEIKAVCIK